MFLKKLNESKREKKAKTSIVDASELESFNFSKRVNYSGKSQIYRGENRRSLSFLYLLIFYLLYDQIMKFRISSLAVNHFEILIIWQDHI